MLVLTRKLSEEIVLILPDGRRGTLRFAGRTSGGIRIGLDMPADVKIHRREILDQIEAGEPKRDPKPVA